MAGAAIGIVFGGVQFALLFAAVRSISGQKLKILPLLLQFFCPMAGLLLCALVKRDQLLICAACIIAILIAGALINFIIYAKRKNSNKDK